MVSIASSEGSTVIPGWLEKDGDMFELHELTDDKGVVKTIKEETYNDPPPERAHVIVHYDLRLSDGNVIESTKDNKQRLSYQLGSGRMPKGFDITVRSMALGEVCDTTISPDYAFGSAGDRKRGIPPNETLFYHIELCEWEAPRDNAKESIEYAMEKKEKGNSYLKRGEYTHAVVSYLKGCMELERSHVQTCIPKELHVALLNNSALAMIKLGNFSDAAENLLKVIDIDKDNAKALYRIALCRKEAGMWRDAFIYVKRATALTPNDKAVLALMAECEKHDIKIEGDPVIV